MLEGGAFCLLEYVVGAMRRKATAFQITTPETKVFLARACLSLSLVVQNNLSKSQAALGTVIERLSSGLRINSAKDDPAGFAIANRFTSNINGLTKAAGNVNDGISMAQTAEGALNEINANLQRIRELAVKAATGTNSTDDLVSIQKEVTQRMAEINRISAQTQFNGTYVLGKTQSITLQVGAHDGDTINLDMTAMDTSSLGLDTIDLTAMGPTDIAILDSAMSKVDSLRGDMGAMQNRLESTINSINNMVSNLSATRSRIMDTDYAAEVSNMIKNQFRQQVGTWLLAQVNKMPQLVLQLLK